MKFRITVLLICAVSLCASLAPAQTTNTNSSVTSVDADKAWKDVLKVTRLSMPPAEWQGHPTSEQLREFRSKQAQAAEEGAEKAKQFYTLYPQHTKSGEARKKELEMLRVAEQLGSTNKSAALAALEEQQIKDPSLSEDQRFKLRMNAVRRSLSGKQGEDEKAVLAAEEKAAQALIREFPKRDDGYQLLAQVAAQSEPAKASELAKQIKASPASEKIKQGVEGILRKMDALGKPVPIKFTAVDGRPVDVSNLAGKVVLLDFWATWCGPCVAEVPNVKKAYDELHTKGFEIVGISFDSDQSKLEDFVKKEGMSWPQYFDGKGWGNKFGQEYGINSIPTMWLVDKKGNLRDMNARGGLEEKVRDLLKE